MGVQKKEKKCKYCNSPKQGSLCKGEFRTCEICHEVVKGYNCYQNNITNNVCINKSWMCQTCNGYFITPSDKDKKARDR